MYLLCAMYQLEQNVGTYYVIILQLNLESCTIQLFDNLDFDRAFRQQGFRKNTHRVFIL